MHLNCSRRLIPAIGTKAESLFPLSDYWFSTISYLQRATAPWIFISHIFCLHPRKPGICSLKDEIPFDFQKEYPGGKTLKWSLSTGATSDTP
jgi:hypothetical protein